MDVEEVILDEGGPVSRYLIEVLYVLSVRPALEEEFPTSPVDLRPSQIHCRGLFAMRMKKGAFEGEYEGQGISTAIADER